MFSIYLYSLVSVCLVSAVSLVGIFTLSLKEDLVRKYIFVLVSLAVGALLGDAFIHLVPESFETFQNPLYASLAVIAGILIFFVLEKILHWHHHLEGEDIAAIHPTGRMILFSDGVHNFIDGLILGTSYLVSVEVGIATTIAIVLHEIPQEIGDFGVLLHSGYTAAKALWFNFVTALLAVSGTVLALLIGSASEFLTLWLIPFAAGGFIYIAMSDLIPELHKTKNMSHAALQFVAVFAGLAAMLALVLVD